MPVGYSANQQAGGNSRDWQQLGRVHTRSEGSGCECPQGSRGVQAAPGGYRQPGLGLQVGPAL